MDFCDLIAPLGITVKEAIDRIDRNGEGTLFLCDGMELAGVITDGDVRRFVSQGGQIGAPVASAANLSPRAVQSFHDGDARALLQAEALSAVPLVDRNNRIHAVVLPRRTLRRSVDLIHNPVVVMAGGLGTRLAPYTNILPKPLIPLGERTITEHIFDWFHRFGCRDFTLVVNHKRGLIKTYFAETEHDYTVRFVDEDKPLGTGGGLAFLKGQFREPIFVTICDAIVEADYSDILRAHREQGNLVTMVCTEHTVTIPYGVVDLAADGRVLAMREKPVSSAIVNTGFYLIEPSLLERIPPDTFIHLTTVIEQCLAAGDRIGSYVIPEDSYIDIGRLDDLHAVAEMIF